MSKKKYIKNVILVMSGGSGSRFGADCPKQYSVMKNRLVIDYVIDECRNCVLADEIVVVAAPDYAEFVRERYSLPVVCGGKTRPESVANGIKYVYENYSCQKLIITNAVCPLASSEQYDKYFNLLDQYDFVLTTWKLAPALHRFDETRVDRDDFFNVMEPDAYRFPMLYENFDFKDLKKYIFHNMPKNCNPYYCFDYPYTMKLTYSYDLKLLELLYGDIIEKTKKESTINTVNMYLSADGRQGVGKWISDVHEQIKELSQKYSVTSYTLNGKTEANIVFEAESQKYGSLIFKFTPSDFHFNKEYIYYKYSSSKIMAPLIGFDKDYNALVLKKVKPGLQVRFNTENTDLREFYDDVYDNLIPIDSIPDDDRKLLPTVIDEFNEYVTAANRFTYEYNLRKILEKKAMKIWDAYFENSPKFYLHRDLHRRNILTCEDKCIAIDPRGAIGPKEFEFLIPFIIELREDRENTEAGYEKMLEYFSKYCEKDRLNAAMFIFWVYKMNDYTFQKNDQYNLASWCRDSVIKLYFGGDKNKALDEEYLPKNLEKFNI